MRVCVSSLAFRISSDGSSAAIGHRGAYKSPQAFCLQRAQRPLPFSARAGRPFLREVSARQRAPFCRLCIDMAIFSAKRGIINIDRIRQGLHSSNSRTPNTISTYREYRPALAGRAFFLMHTNHISILIQSSTTSGVSRSQASGRRMARSAGAKPGEERGLLGGRGTVCGGLRRGPMERGGVRKSVAGMSGHSLAAKGGNGGCLSGRLARPRRASTAFIISLSKAQVLE